MTNTTPHEAGQGTLSSYSTGFVLSIILTLAAYFLVANHLLPDRHTLILILVGLGVAQLLVQVIFFLHLGSESNPRWNLIAFLFAVMVVGIIGFGSLWIMQHLNYNMMQMSPAQLNQTTEQQEAIQK